MFGHFFLDTEGRFLQKNPAQVIYFPEQTALQAAQALCALLNSHLTNYFVKAGANKLSGKTEDKARYEWPERFIASLPIPSARFEEAIPVLAELYQYVQATIKDLEMNSAWQTIRHSNFNTVPEFLARTNQAKAGFLSAWKSLQALQDRADVLVEELYGLDSEEVTELYQPVFRRPWKAPDWDADLVFEITDYICDLIEDLFAAQKAAQERELTPAEIAQALAANPKFEPLRAVYYGGRPISAEQFVRECLDWDCRPIPFDEEAVLVGRKPKRVDVLHERFFRFDGVNRDLYGWTGWSPEAQANIFLTLSEETQDKTPFYRWVSRLISLPEEVPDIEDPGVREGLRSIIGDVEPYPYVVME
jgi:hypothetical protein